MIPIVELIRLEENYNHGTFGILKINKSVFCVTLEPRDEENKSNISSIPAQQYLCGRYSSERFPDTFEVLNVPDRFNILFHSGNVDDDTAGCIILAQYYGKLIGDRAVLNSGDTFRRFMAEMDGIHRFHLTIYEKF